MTSEILNIREGVIIDESVESFQYVEYLPEGGETTINSGGTEIRFVCNNSNNFIYPHKSYLRVEGQLNRADGTAWASTAHGSAIALINNGLLNLFSNFKYELADTVIEYFENIGITTTVHNYLTKSRTYEGEHWFWVPDSMSATVSTNNISFLKRNTLMYSADPDVWYFSACIPLSAISNFCSDYNKVIWGLKHRLIFTRSTGSLALARVNAAIAANGNYIALTAANADGVISLSTLRWVIPQVKPNAIEETSLLSIIQNPSELIDITFLNKRYTTITVTANTTLTAPLATTSGVERPRYIVVIFQTVPGASTQANFINSTFAAPSQLNVTAAYVTLSGVKYPSSDMSTNYTQKRYTKWYLEYLNFYNKYNFDNKSEPCLSYLDFINFGTMYIFDVSNQTENLKRSTVDASLFMTFSAAPPGGTVGYAITYFDSIYKVSSLQLRPLSQVL